MKKIRRRALSVVIIAALVITGLGFYVVRYVNDGADWALYFSGANSGSTGAVFDRNGICLASFSALENNYCRDGLTRVACYHVTGDYWGRTGTGILAAYRNGIQEFDILSGTTQYTDNQMYLNIDSRLNVKAYELLSSDRKGCILLMNYRTGELLCMVSTPSLDPLDNSDPAEGAYINRCLSAAYPPGSVFKLVTAAAAIENIPDLYERRYYCEGVLTIAGVDIKCTGDHYTQDFETALANSCNCAFGRIAVNLGQDVLYEYAAKYGLLESHSLNGIPTVAGNFPSDFIGDPETAWAGIGQSTDLVNPYALLRYVAAIANDGIICEPELIRTEEGSVKSRLVDTSTAQQLQSLMRNNVETHYEGDMKFPGLKLCAKTGTAEVGDGTSHSWFTGFLQDERHPYAFVILVENGGGGLTVSGTLAAELLHYAVSIN